MQHHHFRYCLTTLMGGAAALTAAQVAGADFLEVTALPAVGSPITAGGKDLLGLVGNLITGADAFQPLQAQNFTAFMNYGRVVDALRFDVSGVLGNYAANLTTPFKPGVIVRSFSAATRDDLYNEIKDYMKQNGLEDWSRFLKALNEQSAFGTASGNPNSSTALIATYSFNEYGMAPVETAEEKETAKEATGVIGLAFTGDAGFIRAQGFDANSYSFTPFIPLKLSSRVRLNVGMPLNYTEVGGAQIYRAGVQLGLPILLVKRSYQDGKPTQPVVWQLTPHGGTEVGGSLDLVDGSVINSGGLTSLLGYDFGKVEVSMGNQVTLHESLPVTVGGQRWDPQVSTQIVKNGLKLGLPFAKRWYTEAYAVDTELLGSGNFMSRYLTVGAGIGYRFLGKADAPTKRKGYAMLGAYSNLGKNWNDAHLQLGSGWKF